jgi:hypothetical protein
VICGFLCVPLRTSALKRFFNAEIAEIRRGTQRNAEENLEVVNLFCAFLRAFEFAALKKADEFATFSNYSN